MNQGEIAAKVDISRTAVNQYLNKGILPANKQKADKLKKVVSTVMPNHLINHKHNLREEIVMLSQKAKEIFNLRTDPFREDVQNADDVFLNQQQIYIKHTLAGVAEHGGLLALVGDVGSGKSTLREDLIDRIYREDMKIKIIQPVTIDKSKLTASAICDAIIADISNENPKRTMEAKGRQVQRLLTTSMKEDFNHCLIIEEAQDLSLPTIKHLKRFNELKYGFKKLLSIILVGQLELKNKLDTSQNYEAREVIRRIEIAELRPLEADNIKSYLDLKFKRIDAKNPCDDGVYEAIINKLMIKQRGVSVSLSGAYPLTINNLITSVLNSAAKLDLPSVDEAIIREV